MQEINFQNASFLFLFLLFFITSYIFSLTLKQVFQLKYITNWFIFKVLLINSLIWLLVIFYNRINYLFSNDNNFLWLQHISQFILFTFVVYFIKLFFNEKIDYKKNSVWEKSILVTLISFSLIDILLSFINYF
jgi:hypothetical protein